MKPVSSNFSYREFLSLEPRVVLLHFFLRFAKDTIVTTCILGSSPLSFLAGP